MAARNGHEREVKLAPPPNFRLPDLADVRDGVVATPREPVELQTSYYDTHDLRLARSGISLRHRSDEGWMVKLPERTEADAKGLLFRSELRFEGPPGSPPQPAVDLVQAFTRHAPVERVAKLRTLRRRVDLLDEGGDELVEVVDDEVSVFEGRRIALRFREVEVELAPSTPDEIADAVVARLRQAGVGPPDPTPKVVRALGAQAVAAPDVVVETKLPAHATAADAVRNAIAASVSRLMRHDPGVRLGVDPEDVHQARVAARRLRSDLRTFGVLLDDEWSDALRDELRWLGGELGAVRDVEVLRARLDERIGNLPPEDRLPARGLLEDLDARHREARRALLQSVRTDRYVELLDSLVDAANRPVMDATLDPESTAVAVLPELVARPWKHLQQTVAELGDDPADEALHAVRIRAKRARYAAEAVAPAVGKRARAFARAAANIQDVLGEHQDAVLAEQWLRQAARDAATPVVLAIGQLVAVERQAARAARRRFPKAWRALDRKKLRSWM